MQGQTNKSILSKRLQRTLRNEMTDAEKALWRVLRSRQVSGLKFRRQHPFGDYILDTFDGAKPRFLNRGKKRRSVSTLSIPRALARGVEWVDFVCLEKKLIIEVDGGQHGERAKEDEIRTQNLLTAGFRVLRFWNNEVLQEIEAVKERIWRAVEEQEPHPLSASPLEGERV